MSTKRFTNLMQRKDTLAAAHKVLDYSVEEWYVYWRDNFKATTVKKGTIDSYNNVFYYYIKPFLGHYKINQITSREIQGFYNEMARNDYSKSTISLIHALMTNMFRHAYRLELMEKNPIDLIVLPRGRQKQDRRALSKEEQDLLLRYLKGNDIETLVIFALSTGMRIGEIIGLTWENIDFEKNEVHIREILKKDRNGNFYKDLPKTSKSIRTIPLLPQIIERLNEHKKFQNKRRDLGRFQKERKDLGDLVFMKADGSPYTDLYLCRQLKHIVMEINEDGIPFPDLTPHCLRHTFATRALENGISAKVVQELLGHSSVTLTLDLYTHVMEQTKTQEMQKMSALF